MPLHLNLILKRSFCTAFASFILFTPASMAEETSLEYKIKATYLINFILFVEWPQQSFANDADEISLCIFGVDPYDSFIDELLEVKQL